MDLQQKRSCRKTVAHVEYYGGEDAGGKVRAIRTWIGTTLDTINRYKADHRRVLEDATASLQLVLPLDIATDYVLPFLELPQDPQVMEDRNYRGYR